MPALVIGSALAGAGQVLVPRDALLAIGTDPALSIATMLVLTRDVSLCPNVNAFFVLSFASAFTSGPLVPFLLLGPLLNLEILELLHQIFTTRALVRLPPSSPAAHLPRGP